MTPYYLLYFIFNCIYFVIFFFKINKNFSIILLTSPLLLFSVIFSGFIGSDVNNYRSIYYSEYNFGIEPIFTLLKNSFLTFDFSFLYFSTVYAVLEVALLAFIASKIKESLIFIYFYFSLFYFNFNFNVLRFSLAALLFTYFLFYYAGKYRKIGYIFAFLTHYSFAIAILIRKLSTFKSQTFKSLLIILSFASIIIIFNFSSILTDLFANNILIIKLIDHLNLYEETKTFYPALILKNFLLYILFLNGMNRFYLILYTSLTLLVHLINPGIARLSDLILYLSLIDFFHNSSIYKYRFLSIIFAFILSISALNIPFQDCEMNTIDNWCINENQPNYD